EIRTGIEKQIIEKTQRPVFYATFLPDQVNIPKVRYGLIHKVIKNKKITLENIDWSNLYILREPIKSDIRSISLYQTHFSLLANYFLEKNEIDKAKKNLKILTKLTNNLDALLIIPYYYFQNGNYEKSISEYKELLKINPDWIDVLINLGVVYEKIKEFNLAEECYKRVMRIKPDYPQVYYNMAVLEWQRQNWEEVIKMFNKYLSFKPDDVEVKKYLSIAEKKLKK
ncbi:MAG: tetratricopeptide repeat protein, partial [Endomicrobiia bacterium]